MLELSHGETTVPQVFINGRHIPGGYTSLKALDEANKGQLFDVEEGTVTLQLGELIQEPLTKQKVIAEIVGL